MTQYGRLARKMPIPIDPTAGGSAIGDLAFPEPPPADAVKIGVLLGSLLAAVAGMLILRVAKRN